MSASFNDWCAAVADLSWHQYVVFELDHDKSLFPDRARLHLEYALDQKASAWLAYCRGMTPTFTSCAQSVTDELQSQRAKLDPQFVPFVEERQKNLAVVNDLKSLLSAELAKPEAEQNVNFMVFAIQSMEQRLAADLTDARDLVDNAQAMVVQKLETIVQKLGAALDKPRL